MRLNYILFMLAVLGVFNFQAQSDIHFSQFYNSPVTYNPATVGIIDGDFRAFFNYRSQWSSIMTSPYKSTGVSIDAPMLGDQESGSFFGLGINMFTDKAAESAFKSTGYNFSISYALEVNRGSYFAVGVKGGYLQRSIDYTSLVWKNQFVIDEFDLSRATGETSAADQIATIDLGAGVYYFNKLNEDFSLFGGVAVEHLNSPNVSFLGAEEDYLMKYIGHGGANITKKKYQPDISAKYRSDGSRFKQIYRCRNGL